MIGKMTNPDVTIGKLNRVSSMLLVNTEIKQGLPYNPLGVNTQQSNEKVIKTCLRCRILGRERHRERRS